MLVVLGVVVLETGGSDTLTPSPTQDKFKSIIPSLAYAKQMNLGVICIESHVCAQTSLATGILFLFKSFHLLLTFFTHNRVRP